MKKIIITDREKIEQILAQTKMSRSDLARELEVSYKTVYRWLEKGIQPHYAQSRRIDELFKEHVDLRDFTLKLKQELKSPIQILRSNRALQDKFFLEMTYNSNAIEGSRMTIKETEAAIKGEKVRGKVNG